MRIPTLWASLALTLVLGCLAAEPASSQVIERREGDANPMVAVFKSTVYGAGAGLVLGLAIELVANDADGEALKWGFVAGTAFGFGYGIYHVASRPKPGSGALLEGDLETLEFSVPRPQLALERPHSTSPPTSANLELRVPLASLRF